LGMGLGLGSGLGLGLGSGLGLGIGRRIGVGSGSGVGLDGGVAHHAPRLAHAAAHEQAALADTSMVGGEAHA
jgi:hypothetical protein